MSEYFSLAKAISGAIGLIENLISKLQSLHRIVKGCDSLVHSLSTLAEVLKHVQSTFVDASMNSSPKDATLLTKCVQACHNKCSQLKKCLESIQSAPVPYSKAPKEEKNIDALKRDIESDKSTLNMLMNSISYVLNFDQLCARSRPANLLPFCLVRGLGARVRLERLPPPRAPQASKPPWPDVMTTSPCL